MKYIAITSIIDAREAKSAPKAIDLGLIISEYNKEFEMISTMTRDSVVKFHMPVARDMYDRTRSVAATRKRPTVVRV